MKKSETPKNNHGHPEHDVDSTEVQIVEKKETNDHKKATKTATSDSTSKYKQKSLFVAGLVIVLLAVSMYLFVANDNSQVADDNGAIPAADEIVYDYELEQISQADLRERVEQYTFTNQFDEALELIQYQDYFSSDRDTQLLYASTLINAGRPSEAIEAYKTIETSLGIDRSVAWNIADLAVETGDTELAKEYYQKAIDYMRENPSEFALYEADLEVIENKLNELGT